MRIKRKTKTTHWLHAQNYVYIVTFDLYWANSCEPQVLSTKAADASLYQNVKLSDPELSYIGVGCVFMTAMWENTYQDPAMPTSTYPDPPSTSHKYLWHHILIQTYGCSITTILPVLIKITTWFTLPWCHLLYYLLARSLSLCFTSTYIPQNILFHSINKNLSTHMWHRGFWLCYNNHIRKLVDISPINTPLSHQLASQNPPFKYQRNIDIFGHKMILRAQL